MITKKDLVEALVSNGFEQQIAEATVNQFVVTIQLAVSNRLARNEPKPFRFEAESDKSFHFDRLEKSHLVLALSSMGLHHSGWVLLSILTEKITEKLEERYSIQVEGVGRITRVQKPIWILEAESSVEQSPVS